MCPGLENFTAIEEYYEEYSSSLPFSNPLTSQTTLFASQQMENIVASVRTLDDDMSENQNVNCRIGLIFWLVDSRCPVGRRLGLNTQSSSRPSHHPTRA